MSIVQDKINNSRELHSDTPATDTELALKANIASPTFTGTVGGVDKTMVGLDQVDNTSDADKPVSTATTAAIAVLEGNVLTRTNTDVYGPTSAYEPATKKYVDDTAIVGGTVAITTVQRFVATAGQTIFVPASGYIVGAINVTLNGIELDTTDYVAGDGVNVTLNAGATLDDIVRITVYGGADVYNKAQTDALLGAKANLAAPALTGIPTAPTAPANTNTIQLATTEFVQSNTENTLTSTSITKALSAAQGKVLKDIQDTKVGSVQEAATGTVVTNILKVTQAEYDGLTKNATTAYFIVG